MTGLYCESYYRVAQEAGKVSACGIAASREMGCFSEGAVEAAAWHSATIGRSVLAFGFLPSMTLLTRHRCCLGFRLLRGGVRSEERRVGKGWGSGGSRRGGYI